MVEQDVKKKSSWVIYVLAVAKSARGLKLGTALTFQSMELAKEKRDSWAGLTGIYSQKICRDLDLSFEKQLIY